MGQLCPILNYMFKPNYKLSKNLLTNVTQIERLYGNLEGLKIPKKLELNLERDNLVQSSYVSNSIEGNPLSLREVTNLLLDDRVPVNRDEKEVANYFSILKILSSYAEKPISLNITKDIHRQLMSGVNDKIAGSIRNKKVVIGKYCGNEDGKKPFSLEVKHEPPYHQSKQIASALADLYDWYLKDTETPASIKAGIFHHHFVFIHPFADGNGRVCRLLTALTFLQNDYSINKYFVLDDYYDIDRIQYSDKLHSADSGDKTEWLEYFSDGVKYSLQSALSRIEGALFKLKIEERPTAKERQVLEIVQEQKEVTSSDVAKVLDVSRQQAHSLLKSLIEKGFLTRKGTTKSSYYLMK